MWSLVRACTGDMCTQTHVRNGADTMSVSICVSMSYKCMCLCSVSTGRERSFMTDLFRNPPPCILHNCANQPCSYEAVLAFPRLSEAYPNRHSKLALRGLPRRAD